MAPAYPNVSLVMPNRNNAGVLDLTLSKLAEHTTYPSFELVVVDDGSTDGSRALLRRWRDSGAFGGMKVLEREHSGAPAGLNAGVEAAEGELVVQLDADATVETPGWLEQLVGLHEADARVGVVCGAVILDSGRVHAYGVNMICPEGMHDGGTTITEPVGRRTLNGAVVRPRAADVPPPSTPCEVDASIGVCMLYSKSLWAEAGGYDHGFAPVWFDDLDLSLAARRLGTKVFLHGAVRVIHRVSMRDEDPGPFRRVARHLPQRVKDLVVSVGRLDRPDATARARLAHHYTYWREKWGFDPLNPDMAEVFARYGDSEVCWRHDYEMREEGERIAQAFVTREPLSA